MLKTIEYEDKNSTKLEGYNATILPLMCKMYLDERQQKALKTQQLPLASASKILLIGLSNIGITTLIEEATDYQYDRERFELQKLLSAYISDEILKWQLAFTEEFYKQVYRLLGLSFIPKYIKNKPSFIGKLTSKSVYDMLPNVVIQKIKENTGKTDKGNWKYK